MSGQPAVIAVAFYEHLRRRDAASPESEAEQRQRARFGDGGRVVEEGDIVEDRPHIVRAGALEEQTDLGRVGDDQSGPLRGERIGGIGI